jgi:hypothetical protein
MSTAAVQQGEQVRVQLRRGPAPARGLMAALGVSQPTLSRALKTLGPDLLPFGAARSIQYALRDPARAELQAPVFRVTPDGQLVALGTLVPVCREGFVMQQRDGVSLHTDGLPWWLFDMRPQGFLGRAYNQMHGERLGLPQRLGDWNDTHVLRALLFQGDDLPGNLLVGAAARERFVNTPAARPIAEPDKAAAYARLAEAAVRGEVQGSSAGGEQPKFTACADVDGAVAHVIVKFTARTDTPVSERWRDLLWTEHTALGVLRDHGIAAARTSLHVHGTQRFLEVQRFDRDGALGRRALFSIAALDAEFVGSPGPWPGVVRALAARGIVRPEAVAGTDVLWAFGTLIANTDMHGGNLSFMAERGRPYELAPAYDMTCMGFAPSSTGDLPERELPLQISGDVSAAAWHQALAMARDFLQRLQRCDSLSEGFRPCLAALAARIADAADRIARLAPA